MSIDQWPDDPAEQKRQWMETRTSNEQLQSRLKATEAENKRLRQSNSDLLAQKDKQQRDTEQQLAQYTVDVQRLEKECAEFKKGLQKQEEIFDGKKVKYTEVQDATQKQLLEQINELQRKNFDLEAKDANVADYDPAMDSHTRKVVDLKKLVEQLKLEKLQEVNAIEREKIQVTEKLRKEMLLKIKETKANLLAMNDEQLQTTTRLTILQNQQLTTELEYQSKQCEQLLFRNNKMKEKIDALTRDVQIHQDVEKELAKRSHYSQKIIKRLKDRVRDLEASQAERLHTLQPDLLSEPFQSPAAAKYGTTPARHRRRNGHSLSVLGPGPRSPLKGKTPGRGQQNEDLIQFLEHKIDQVEVQLSRAQQDYSDLQVEYRELHDKFTKSSDKYKKAALIMTEFLDDLLSQSPNILQSAQDMHLNIERVRETPLEKMEKEDKVALVLVLLKQLQPYLSAGTMSTQATSATPSRRFNTMAPQSMTPDYDYQTKMMQGHASELLKKPHRTDGSVSEVDALQNILQNINVHHEGRGHRKFNSIQVGQSNNSVKLPPI